MRNGHIRRRESDHIRRRETALLEGEKVTILEGEKTASLLNSEKEGEKQPYQEVRNDLHPQTD